MEEDGQNEWRRKFMIIPHHDTLPHPRSTTSPSINDLTLDQPTTASTSQTVLKQWGVVIGDGLQR